MIPSKVCIAYVKGEADTHAAYSKSDRIYTFPLTGEYLVVDNRGIAKRVYAVAGQTTHAPQLAVERHCGSWFERLMKRVGFK